VAAGSGPVSVTVEPSGQFAYVSAFAINGNSGALTAVGPPVSVGTNPFSIQPRQRHPAAVGTPVAAGATPTSVAVEPTGKFVYLTNHNSNSVSVFAIPRHRSTNCRGLACRDGHGACLGHSGFSGEVRLCGERHFQQRLCVCHQWQHLGANSRGLARGLCHWSCVCHYNWENSVACG